jgi:oligopeptide/dipeptide ABC transporter ATP-binding protein
VTDGYRPGAPLLEVEDLTVSFRGEAALEPAVRGVSLVLDERQVLGIVGESGAGKSVTSLAVMGLLPRTARIAGSVRFRGRELLGSSEKDMESIRGKEIAMVFQDPMTSLNPVYTVGWQLVEAIRAHQDIPKERAEQRAVDLLETVGIPNAAARVHSYPHELSGGMRQRVVIAIAMANDPDVILADEPTTALDVTIQAQVLEALRAARERTRAAMILVTHDLGVIAGLADQVMVMYAGKAVEVGSVEDIFYRARMPYTVGLLGALPRLDSDDREKLRPIPGSPPSLSGLRPGCPFAPRCPLATEICEEQEPVLIPVEGPDHRAACHHIDEVERRGPTIFAATSVDPEAVAVGQAVVAAETTTP